MSEHTPAPWMALHKTVIEKPVKIREHFAISPPSGPTFAFLPEGRVDVQEANARLIAAAPEMLEVLKEIQSYLKDDVTDMHRYRRLMDEMNAAIAKAEGKN